MTATATLDEEVGRYNTTAWINADPLEVVLVRRTVESDGAGGWIPGPAVNLPTQVMRLVTEPYQQVLRTDYSGTQRRVELVLVGTHDADMVARDTFGLEGVTYSVVFVDRNAYRAKGEVVRVGV